MIRMISFCDTHPASDTFRLIFLLLLQACLRLLPYVGLRVHGGGIDNSARLQARKIIVAYQPALLTLSAVRGVRYGGGSIGHSLRLR